ncbi:hypothetical protein CANCADRAFT_25969 [Tortispora caseinolytica NRRL Y-17796]|uniref:Uncharacterized protein n=1 Tax=Tortispora caseinolytica NRRL Y-17796 TaxID=767744 RepID=A0A1E4THF7_9ASCO|nr:hypothetical protein CANCADRAFT_25969 [Tortispora caseinolytica NRRL Y-17796]
MYQAKWLTALLVLGMLLTGSSNSLLTKFQDMICVGNCDNPDPAKHEHFAQPALQSLQMFLAEAFCWFYVALGLMYVRAKYGVLPQDRESTPLSEELPAPSTKTRISHRKMLIYLAITALCDATGTTLMQTGLLFIPVSVYQMLRGALVLFVGIFSVVFLKRKLQAYHWYALVVVLFGVFLVGFSNALSATPGAHSDVVSTATKHSSFAKAIIGVLLVAVGQLFTASQFVLEEYVLELHPVDPIQVVGYEGVFGFIGMTILVAILYPLPITKPGGYFDVVHGWNQLISHSSLMLSSLLIMLSISLFNVFGLSVTRIVSAATRSQIDTCRTVVIWVVSLLLGWESFKLLQLIGFILLVYGTLLFNDLVQRRILWWKVDSSDNARPEPLLPQEPMEHI